MCDAFTEQNNDAILFVNSTVLIVAYSQYYLYGFVYRKHIFFTVYYVIDKI